MRWRFIGVCLPLSDVYEFPFPEPDGNEPRTRTEYFMTCTITNREVQNLIKHFCSATMVENRLKFLSAVEIVNPLNAIPIFWRAKIKQALLPEGCRRDKSKSCRSAKRVTFVTHVLAEPIRSFLHSESIDDHILSRFSEFVSQSSQICYN